MQIQQLSQLTERIAQRNPRLSPLFSLEFGDAVVGVVAEDYHRTAAELKDAGFDRLGMVTAIDRPDGLEMVCRLHSRSLGAAIFLKTTVSHDEPHVESLCDLWLAADWQEREVYDLFGVVFDGHPDLRRIVLPEDFVGHPLRKDFDAPNVVRRPDYL